MRRLLCVAVITLSMQATFGQTLPKSDTRGSDCLISEVRRSEYHDPIDYRAVAEHLAKASKGRSIKALFSSSQVDTTRRLSLSPRFRAGYRRETGPLVALTLNGRYRRGSAAIDAGVSVKGWYLVRFSGRNLFNEGQTLLSYEASWERFPTYFYGLGYRASHQNRRTTYYRITQSVSGVCAQRVWQRLWADFTIRFSREVARGLSDRGREYLRQAGAKTLSVTTTALSAKLRYDSRSLSDSLVRGVRVSVEQEVRPKMLGDFPHTLWHTSVKFSGYCPLWRGAVWESDINGEFFSYATPWLLWPSVGADNRLRIYSYGRYIDRNMVAAHITLHQRIYGPVGCDVWGGAVNMFSERVVWRHTLPSYGVGVRAVTDEGLTVKIGYGFGRHTHGVVIGINDRF